MPNSGFDNGVAEWYTNRVANSVSKINGVREIGPVADVFIGPRRVAAFRFSDSSDRVCGASSRFGNHHAGMVGAI